MTAPVRRYIYGPGVDEPIVMVDYTDPHQTGDPAVHTFYHQDRRSSVVALSDEAGAEGDIYTYDSHGVPDSWTGNRIRFTGRWMDHETGLYYYRARFYSPGLGRFLQTDPIGYGDNMNMYAYVGGDPVNFGDPSGMATIDCTSNSTSCPDTTEFDNLQDGDVIETDFASVEISVTTDSETGETTTEGVVTFRDSSIGPEGFIDGAMAANSGPIMVPHSPPDDPDGQSVVDRNRGSARGMVNPLWFRRQVRSGGPWDYKQYDSSYEDFGNFNYGATGHRMIGLSDATLLRMAGWAQVRAGNVDQSFGVPVGLADAMRGTDGAAPYGDDPVDQFWIQMGIRYDQAN